MACWSSWNTVSWRARSWLMSATAQAVSALAPVGAGEAEQADGAAEERDHADRGEDEEQAEQERAAHRALDQDDRDHHRDQRGGGDDQPADIAHPPGMIDDRRGAHYVRSAVSHAV